MTEATLTLPDGRLLTYLDLGDPQGHPVFHTHGAPSSKLETRFFGLDAHARSAGIRLIALDRPGIGGSTPQAGRTLLDWGSDVADAASVLGIERFGLFGYSIGAASALAARMVCADRVSATLIVSGVGPADVPGITEGRSPDVSRIIAMSTRMPGLTRAGLAFMRWGTKNPAKMIAATGKGMPPADRAVADRPGAAEPFAAFLRDALRQGTAGALRDLQLVAGPWGFTPTAAGGPLGIWHGKADTNVPAHAARWLATAVPGAIRTVTQDDGHISLLDSRGAEVLEWLSAAIAEQGSPRVEAGGGR
ncbi:alpha/beta fold hydrolase [Ruicaihuangia caeni]|uniref:Alpha/beta hydrolase n=1 Tax=Ruicaihuangia caeni TaxID=3042517 RepID=A0AAW6TAI1_9MICO|nr:alpha/beta hydrolase [Klugiella sp. YN-L-19]MDI2098793.1 alpha/beta hydrolase [Klugiella sp. YN-L-19]